MGLSQAGCSTVLMSVRVSVCHSGIRPLCLPGAGDESLRLQLSMDPGKAGEFRLALRDTSGASTGRSVSIVEYNLRDIRYELKSSRCHELALLGQPDERMTFNLKDEKEAQEWSTIITTSVREVQRVAATSSGVPLNMPPSRAQDRTLQLEHLLPKASAELPRTEELSSQLSQAIEAGDMQTASDCAMALARQQVSLRIQQKESNYMEKEISIKVGVEDATTSCCVTVKVFPYMTISSLKQQVFRDYGFHSRVQRWVIGQSLCADSRTLASYGVRRDGDTAFLYLVSARQAQLSRQRYEEEQEITMLSAGEPLSNGNRLPPLDRRGYSTLPTRLPQNRVPVRDGGAERMGVGDIRELINLEMLQLNEALSLNPANRAPSSTMPTGPQTGWSCPSCTYINKPTRPGCEICSHDRPMDYVVPGGYQPDEEELWRIQQEKEAVWQYQQVREAQRRLNFETLLQTDSQDLVPNQQGVECRICYLELGPGEGVREAQRRLNFETLLQTDSQDLVPNQQGVECRICYLELGPGEGVLLRECLHCFCRDCLRSVINLSDDPEVSCPYRDEAYACHSKIQEREIRALVSPEQYRCYLDRGLAVAESRSDSSYHCATPDCRGWCEYEDSVNEFPCPICKKRNCLLCKAIHEGMNCRQYQDDLQFRAINDSAARKTTEMLNVGTLYSLKVEMSRVCISVSAAELIGVG
ncbi:UNVERIFIED_CONTAM: hypothetical protein FKN15_050894 [Acipenser sinensis]